jgi:hypothetical protein
MSLQMSVRKRTARGRFLAGGACLLGVIVLAGCGDDSGGGKTVTETVTTDQTESAPSTDTGAAEARTTTGTTQAPDRQIKRGPHYFETPSSNVGCFIDPKAVRCDIRERNWDPPPDEENCELDYGQGIALSASGEAKFVCAGDTTLGGPATLPYGAVSRRGALRCRSGTKGITCSEAAGGHGFFLSRESYRIF